MNRGLAKSPPARRRFRGSQSAETAPPSPADEETNDDARIGAVLRAERRRRGWSLNELSGRIGLSIAMLSQIERGLSTPSLRTLRALAAALELPITRFFEGPQASEGASPYILKKAMRLQLNINSTGMAKTFLTPSGRGNLEMWELHLAPNGASGENLHAEHGEKAGFVSEGKLRLWLDDQPHLLEEGDTFRFPATIRHRIDNPFSWDARVVWILTEP